MHSYTHETMHFKLPLPPSINNDKWISWRTGRIIKKDEVRTWKKTAFYLLSDIHRQDEPREWALNLRFVFYYVKTQRKIDTDNRLKPLFDAISQRLDIDDSLLKSYTVVREFVKGREEHYVEGDILIL